MQKNTDTYIHIHIVMIHINPIPSGLLLSNLTESEYPCIDAEYRRNNTNMN
jgi:hypothetical protein